MLVASATDVGADSLMVIRHFAPNMACFSTTVGQTGRMTQIMAVGICHRAAQGGSGMLPIFQCSPYGPELPL